MRASNKEAQNSSWLCCQLGAREHYAVPRALHLNGLLREFITDLWIRPGTLTNWQDRLATRFHSELVNARVTAANAAALTFELRSQAAGLGGWELIGKRNDWFQESIVTQLARRERELDQQPLHVFAYSYAAKGIFKFARERGWRTVLGQIDPGPAEERLVAHLHHNGNANGWKPAPESYWHQWRDECELAEEIVVNSTWSRDALTSEGISANKIRVIPLAFQTSKEAQSFRRTYPSAFTSDRPLRVLFLGQINLRKGARQLLDAARVLDNEPVEFWFVGPQQIPVPADLKGHSRIKRFGAVSRFNVDRFYRDADVFILPTLSDGFGLTQLEAQSWRLPVIASRFCGAVVQHGRNGIILEEVSRDAIAAVIGDLLRAPDKLVEMSEHSYVRDEFSLQSLASSFSQL
ncbi:MAG TPA: glycosyltransferase family 4 protein [Pyrinomonadaceae bacterium]|jgi:glycosyltransferase involved in cell wall biosynthesis